MRPYPIFVAFHSDLFAAAGDRLRARCDELGIVHDICDREELLSGFRGELSERGFMITSPRRRVVSRYIPVFCMEKLRAHGQPILYLHADSEIRRKPPAKCFNGDFMYSWGDDALPTGKMVLSNPVYYNHSMAALDVLGELVDKCLTENSGSSEHDFMELMVLNGHKDMTRFDVEMSGRRRDVGDPYIFY